MADQYANGRTDEQGIGGALKRRGLIAGAAALVAGLALARTAQPVAAAVGGTNGTAAILGANTFDVGASSNTASQATVIEDNGGTFRGYSYNKFDGIVGIASSDGFGVRGSGGGTGGGVAGHSFNGRYGVYGSGSTGTGVYGESSGDGFSKGVHGKHYASGYAVYGEATASGGYGVTGVSGDQFGVLGQSTGGIGVQGQITGGTVANTTGVQGINSSTGAGGIGVYGSTGAGVYGVYGTSALAGGCGVRGDCIGGTGVLGSVGDGYGVLGQANTGNGVRGFANLNHAIVGQTARPYYGGVFGVATITNTVGIYGSTFNGSSYNANAFAGYMDGNFVVSNGFKSAAVKHTDGSHRLVYCMESPENWFEDFGEGKVVGGKADVKIDPDFAAVVDTAHYHVFVTERGESNGLYVSQQATAGFTVQERAKGTSSLGFSYRIVAKRKDIKAERLAKFDLPGKAKVDVSVPTAPPPPGASHVARVLPPSPPRPPSPGTVEWRP